jgi:hypothetical protein
MRRTKAMLILMGLSLAMGLVGALAAAPAHPVSSHDQPIVSSTHVVESEDPAGVLADFAGLCGFVDDALLDWDTVVYLLFGDAVKTQCPGDLDSPCQAASGEDDAAYRCDPHPDTPK